MLKKILKTYVPTLKGMRLCAKNPVKILSKIMLRNAGLQKMLL